MFPPIFPVQADIAYGPAARSRSTLVTGCLATWTDDITVRGFKVPSKASPACFASLSRDKIDASQPTASSPAAACPCGYREVNKLQTKQVTKRNKGQGVNRV